MNTKKLPVLSILSTLLSLILAIGVMTVFKACGPAEDGTWMHCHTAQNRIMLFGFLLTAVSLISVFVHQRAIRLILSIVGMVLSILAFLTPGTLVSMCMMKTMRCYAVMQPFTRVLSAVICILSLTGLIQSLRRNR